MKAVVFNLDAIYGRPGEGDLFVAKFRAPAWIDGVDWVMAKGTPDDLAKYAHCEGYEILGRA